MKFKQHLIPPININEVGQLIYLQSKTYQVFLLGGWGVKLGDFMLHLKHVSTGEIQMGKKVSIPTQTYACKRRAKRIFTVDIKETGQYEIAFRNTDTLEVKRSNLLISSSFMSSIPNSELQILLTEKTGIFPINK